MGKCFKSIVTLKKNVAPELVINNKLNEKTLQSLVEKSRKTILNMLMECENNYKKGILIFKEIIKDKTIVAEEKRIEKLKVQEKQLLYMTPVVNPRVKKDEPGFVNQTYPGSIKKQTNPTSYLPSPQPQSNPQSSNQNPILV